MITYEQYIKLTDYLKQKENPALLPIQIAYYTGLRIGEACALTWQDIDLDNQCLTVRRSMRYNGAATQQRLSPAVCGGASTGIQVRCIPQETAELQSHGVCGMAVADRGFHPLCGR